MDKIINERFIKLSSRLPYAKAIELGEDVTVAINGHSFIANCVKNEEFDNQDGTVNVVHVLKFTNE